MRAAGGVLRRKPTRVLANVALLFSLLAFAGLVVGPALGLYRTVTVLSGSMRPAFGPGDAIVVSPEPARDLRAGQVITFQSPTGDRHVETHRVVAVLRRGDEPIVMTKGDANVSRDPWRAQLHGETVWRYRFRLPMLGYPILALRSPWAQALVTMLLPALLALWALARLWTPPRAVHRRHAVRT
jgi:signal peptidase I